MKLSIRGGSMRWLCITAAAARVFFGTVIDLPDLYGACWISGLAGGLLFFPFAWIMDAISKRHDAANALYLRRQCGPAVDVLYALLCAYMLFDAACIALGTACSAGYVALRENSSRFLLITLMLILWYAVCANGTGLGGAARLWALTFPWLMAVVFIIQFSGYRFGYLAPILGKNRTITLGSTVKSAGWYGILIPAWLVCEPDRRQKLSMVRCLASACAISTLLMALYGMETPPAAAALHTRVFQMNAVLTNGRFPLSLQIPLIIMWFCSLLHFLGLALFCSAYLLGLLWKKADGRLIVLLCCAAVYAAAGLGCAEQVSAIAAAGWTYMGLWALAAAAGLSALIRRRSACEKLL